jgi:2-iminoacetate synthase ThiH
MRGYLIESLIREGITELVFVGGTAPPLNRYARYIRTVQISLNSQAYKRLARVKSMFMPGL